MQLREITTFLKMEPFIEGIKTVFIDYTVPAKVDYEDSDGKKRERESMRFAKPDGKRNENSFIILHHTSCSLKETLGIFTSTDPETGKPFHLQRPVSAHFVVPENNELLDGTDSGPFLCKLIPEKYYAYHAGLSAFGGKTRLNECTIGIETVNLGYGPFEGQQIDTIATLCVNLLAQNPQITAFDIISHGDIGVAKLQQALEQPTHQEAKERESTRAALKGKIGTDYEDALKKAKDLLNKLNSQKKSDYSEDQLQTLVLGRKHDVNAYFNWEVFYSKMANKLRGIKDPRSEQFEQMVGIFCVPNLSRSFTNAIISGVRSVKDSFDPVSVSNSIIHALNKNQYDALFEDLHSLSQNPISGSFSTKLLAHMDKVKAVINTDGDRKLSREDTIELCKALLSYMGYHLGIGLNEEYNGELDFATGKAVEAFNRHFNPMDFKAEYRESEVFDPDSGMSVFYEENQCIYPQTLVALIKCANLKTHVIKI